MRLAFFLVDAFAGKPGQGNPAGVVVLGPRDEISAEQMTTIAEEVGKSETAFVRQIDSGFSIRWFSPRGEMPLCGHATLAASKALTDRFGAPSPLRFAYAGGEITVNRTSDDFYEMSFPIDDYGLIGEDAVFAEFFGKLDVIECIYGERTKKTALIVAESTALRAIEPDFELMRRSTGFFAQGIGISKKGGRYDIESRYFNPWAGVNEDPVTGSVHTVLGKYWSDRLGKAELAALQDSQRPGVLALKIEGQRIKIGGRAVIAIDGSIAV